MSKLTERLSACGVHNSWGFAGHGNVYIAYLPNDNGRGGMSARWQVIRPGYRTDPAGPWYNGGHKIFTLFGGKGTHKEMKSAALEQAQRWASERYGIKEWAKTPFGDWMDADFVKQRIASLTETVQA